MWTEEASHHAGIHVVITSFAGHSRTLPVDQCHQLKVLALDDELRSVEATLSCAARLLGRRIPSSDYVRKLLLRSVYQAADVHMLFAVGHLARDPAASTSSVKVDGGTAWACQVFAMLQVSDRGRGGKSWAGPLPMYIFSVDNMSWYQARARATDGMLDVVRWVPVTEDAIPSVRGHSFAGIGARDCADLPADMARQVRDNIRAVLSPDRTAASEK